jgi:hypothetical protein
MQLIINLPDIIPNKILRLIQEVEDALIREGVAVEIRKNTVVSKDSWDDLDVNAISVDTGIKDFAENHDHYLYGLPKQS